VTCQTSAPAAPLPPGVDLTAYRIIQEALTNALRHAPGSAAAVVLTYEAAHLSVEVANTPSPMPAAPSARAFPPAAAATPAAAPAGGYGLAGIAERVASCGGSLALGPAPDGGFTVTARLPLS
jgi:signal transduction histidine kinase